MVAADSPDLAVGDAHHVLGAGAGSTLGGDEAEHVLRRDLGGVLAPPR